jgi:nitric oxide reductase subunit C
LLDIKIYIAALLFILFLMYTILVYTAGTTSDIKMNSQAIAGKVLYQKHNCTACHQLYGLGGFLGPELTTVMSQPGRPDYSKAILKTGTRRMPDFHLSDLEINSVIEYLKYVDRTATTYKK